MAGNPSPVYPVLVDTEALRARVEGLIRRHDLIAPGGEVTCLVSGGADSTCLWHALTELGYRVSALHVNHGLRGEVSDDGCALLRRAVRGGRGRRRRWTNRGRLARDPVLVRKRPGSETARILGWSASKVSRIETGRIGISPTDLDRLLDLYQVPDEQARYLRRLAPAARTRGWWDAYADSLSAGYSGLLRLEAGSQALSCYCAVVPHPLLMTPEYVRQVVLATWQAPSAQEADRRVRICVRRQAVIQPRDPHPATHPERRHR